MTEEFPPSLFYTPGKVSGKLKIRSFFVLLRGQMVLSPLIAGKRGGLIAVGGIIISCWIFAASHRYWRLLFFLIASIPISKPTRTREKEEGSLWHQMAKMMIAPRPPKKGEGESRLLGTGRASGKHIIYPHLPLSVSYSHYSRRGPPPIFFGQD